MLKEDTFKGKNVLITGGGTGLGKAMALRFAELGANLFLFSRNPEHLQKTQVLIEKKGVKCGYAAGDIREEKDVKTAVAKAKKELGRVDCLVNNAAGNFVCAAQDLSYNGWNAVIGIVLNGTFLMTKEVGSEMIADKKGGRILNIIATYAWTGCAGVVHSAAAKAGVVAMSRTLASEWAQFGIKLNCLAPGPIQTEGAAEKLWPTVEDRDRILSGIPANRFGRPEEVAELAAFLSSDIADYITGEVVTLDGGQWFGRNSIFK